MNARKRIFRTLGLALFWLGILLAVALAGAGTMADLEATFYGFPWYTHEPLPGFKCPILMTRWETGIVSLTLKNPTDRTIPFLAHADISTPGLTREVQTKVEVLPGEKQRIEWTVTSADVDLGYFIFVNGWSNPAYPYPTRQSMCGIVVLNVPGLTGQQIFVLTLVISVLSMAGGMYLWITGSRPLVGRRQPVTGAMVFLGLAVLAALVVSIAGTWILGIILLALVVLTITGLLVFVLSE